jgi:hypothetical protein
MIERRALRISHALRAETLCRRVVINRQVIKPRGARKTTLAAQSTDLLSRGP